MYAILDGTFIVSRSEVTGTDWTGSKLGESRWFLWKLFSYNCPPRTAPKADGITSTFGWKREHRQSPSNSFGWNSKKVGSAFEVKLLNFSYGYGKILCGPFGKIGWQVQGGIFWNCRFPRFSSRSGLRGQVQILEMNSCMLWRIMPALGFHTAHNLGGLYPEIPKSRSADGHSHWD